MLKLNFIEKLFKKNDEKQIKNKNNNEEELKKEDKKIILTHNEILYSNEKTNSPQKTQTYKTKPISEQRTWRDVGGIEKKLMI